MNRPVAVVGLGQCALDVVGRLGEYPPPDQKAELDDLRVQGGGPVATALVTLARLGVRTAFCGCVGDDDFGTRIRSGLAEEKVDCRHLQTVAGATSQFAFIVVDGTARRTIFWNRGNAGPLDPGCLPEDLLVRSRILHLDGLQARPSLAAARIAREAGVTTVLDGGTWREGTPELLPLIDHLVVGEKFARQVAGENLEAALERLVSFGARAVTVTRGGQGSLTLGRDGRCFTQPAFAVDAVDTTGCGDVFHGGYIYGLLQEWPLERTVRFAAACAALKTRALGGRTAIPTLEEVRELLAMDGNRPGR